jgi:hypothetical protein
VRKFVLKSLYNIRNTEIGITLPPKEQETINHKPETV